MNLYKTILKYTITAYRLKSIIVFLLFFFFYILSTHLVYAVSFPQKFSPVAILHKANIFIESPWIHKDENKLLVHKTSDGNIADQDLLTIPIDSNTFFGTIKKFLALFNPRDIDQSAKSFFKSFVSVVHHLPSILLWVSLLEWFP